MLKKIEEVNEEDTGRGRKKINTSLYSKTSELKKNEAFKTGVPNSNQKQKRRLLNRELKPVKKFRRQCICCVNKYKE